MMNNGHYVSYPSSVGYADTFPPRGRLKIRFTSIRTVGGACPYKRFVKFIGIYPDYLIRKNKK